MTTVQMTGRHRHSKGENDAITAEMLLMAEGGDDALLDSLVKTATQAPQRSGQPRERKRSRHADRKSCEYQNMRYSWSLNSCPRCHRLSPSIFLTMSIDMIMYKIGHSMRYRGRDFLTPTVAVSTKLLKFSLNYCVCYEI